MQNLQNFTGQLSDGLKVLVLTPQGEKEEEINKSMRAYGFEPAIGRLSSAQYWAAHEKLQSHLPSRLTC